MVSKSREAQIITPIAYDEVVAAQEISGIDYDRRLTLSRLVQVTSEHLDLPLDYASVVDQERARPYSFRGGLYVRRDDPRHETAKLLHRDVVFPSQEFDTLVNSPREFTKRIEARIIKANQEMRDRDELNHKTHRGAGEALKTKIFNLGSLSTKLANRNLLLDSLSTDMSSEWQAHYKARNLESRREEVDQIIHETAEVSSYNMEWGDAAVSGLHKAIKFHLYRKDDHPQHRRTRWLEYMKVVRQHTHAKLAEAAKSKDACLKEFEKYAPYLEDVLF